MYKRRQKFIHSKYIRTKPIVYYVTGSALLHGKNTICRGEAAKLAHLIESASLKRKYMYKNYEKIFI